MNDLTVSEEKISDELNEWFGAGLDSDKPVQQAPLFREKPIQILTHDENGNRLAGLAGKIFWDWLYIDMLWVEKKQRQQGLGTALMRRAEQEAQKRGCVGIYLWTESFQAPEFYKKLGYQQFTVIDNFPKGHQRIGFIKRLAA